MHQIVFFMVFAFHQIPISVGAPPLNPLRELITLLQIPYVAPHSHPSNIFMPHVPRFAPSLKFLSTVLVNRKWY